MSGSSLTRELLTRGVGPAPGQKLRLLLVRLQLLLVRRQLLLVCLLLVRRQPCCWYGSSSCWYARHIDDLIFRLISNESHFLLHRLNIASLLLLLLHGHYRGTVNILLLRLGNRLLPRSAACNCCCSCACNALLLRLGRRLLLRLRHGLCRRSSLGNL